MASLSGSFMRSIPRSWSRALAALAVLIAALGAVALAPCSLLGGWGAASAQVPGLPNVTGSSSTETRKPVPPERRSARATIRTFLDSAVAASKENNAELLDAAVACLDLSSVTPGARASTGRDLAIKLKEVIDRIEFIVYAKVPDDPNGPPWVFYHDAAIAADIVIGPNADGEWLFTSETVQRIEDLYARFESMPKVAGVGGSGMDMSPALWMRSKMPLELREKGFLLEHWQWLGLVILVIAGWLVAVIARFILHGPVQRLLDRRDWRVPRDMVWRLLQPTGFVAMALLWVIGVRWIGLPPGTQVIVMLVVKFMAAFGLVRGAFRFIDIVTWVLRVRAERTPQKFDDLLVPFFDKTAKVVIVAIGIVFIADVLGISPTSLLAGLGIGGLAVALAAQDTVKNLFGSLTVILDRPFEIGDDIKIGADLIGTVEEVGFRSTRLRTWDHTLITIPNGNLISANVDNLGKRSYWRYRALLSLTYDTPPAKIHAFCEGLRELVQRHPETRKEVMQAGLFELGQSSLDVLFVCHFTVKTGAEHVKARHELLCDVVALADRLGVEFAFPTRTIHMVPIDPSTKGKGATPEDGGETDRIGRAEALALSTQAEVAKPE